MDENAALKNPLPAPSVMKETLIRSVIDSAMSAESIGLPNNKIIVSKRNMVTGKDNLDFIINEISIHEILGKF